MYKIIVIGVSSGGLKALAAIMKNLDPNFKIPIVIVQHVSKGENTLPEILSKHAPYHIVEAKDKMPIINAKGYIAPPDYHLLIEKDFSFSLSNESRVNYSRPAIDVLFETAADAFYDEMIGIVLTGANADGAQGLKAIKEVGGLTIAQDPESAEVPIMPQAAIEATEVDYILTLESIADKLNEINIAYEKSTE